MYNCEFGRRVKCLWNPSAQNSRTCRQDSECHEIAVDHAEAYNRYTSIVDTHGNGITLCSRWALNCVFRARYTLFKDSLEQKSLPFCHLSCENSRFPTNSVLMTEQIYRENAEPQWELNFRLQHGKEKVLRWRKVLNAVISVIRRKNISFLPSLYLFLSAITVYVFYATKRLRYAEKERILFFLVLRIKEPSWWELLSLGCDVVYTDTYLWLSENLPASIYKVVLDASLIPGIWRRLYRFSFCDATAKIGPRPPLC
jgi:hypothetical protein